MLVFGGIALIAIGMIFGDIFAVFILHQNAGEQGAALSRAAQAMRKQNPAGVNEAFGHLGALLESAAQKLMRMCT